MQRFGTTLLIFGIGSFVLPMMGRQFFLMSFFGKSLPVVAGIMVVAGIAMLIMGRNQG